MKCPNCNKEVNMLPYTDVNGRDGYECPECGITFGQTNLDSYPNMNVPTAEDVYWNEFRDRAAMAAMQGMVAFNGGSMVDIQRCVELADVLVAKLKKK